MSAEHTFLSKIAEYYEKFKSDRCIRDDDVILLHGFVLEFERLLPYLPDDKEERINYLIVAAGGIYQMGIECGVEWSKKR